MSSTMQQHHHHQQEPWHASSAGAAGGRSDGGGPATGSDRSSTTANTAAASLSPSSSSFLLLSPGKYGSSSDVGNFIERSTSAPPPETSFLFGTSTTATDNNINNNINGNVNGSRYNGITINSMMDSGYDNDEQLFSTNINKNDISYSSSDNNYHQQRVLDRRGNTQHGSIISNNSRNDNGGNSNLSSAEALFLDSLRNGASHNSNVTNHRSLDIQTPASHNQDRHHHSKGDSTIYQTPQKSLPPPGFSPSFLASNSTTQSPPPSTRNNNNNNNRNNGDDILNLGSLDRQMIGETLVRSHSAAPSFDAGRFSSSTMATMTSGSGRTTAINDHNDGDGSHANAVFHHSSPHNQHLGEILSTTNTASNRQTPLVSNRSPESSNNNNYGVRSGGAGGSSSKGAGIDSYLESNLMDRSHILQLGQRRPASTGIIGDHHHHLMTSSSVLESLGLGNDDRKTRGTTAPSQQQQQQQQQQRHQLHTGPVRPAAKTLMDLIQEDYPPESPLDISGESYGQDDNFVSFQQRSDTGYGLERPRTTSPPMSSSATYPDHHRQLQQQHQQHGQYAPDFPMNQHRERIDMSRRVDTDDHLNRPDHNQIFSAEGNNYSPRYYTQGGVPLDQTQAPIEYMVPQRDRQDHYQEVGPSYSDGQQRPQPSRPRPLRPGQHAPPSQYDQAGPLYGGPPPQDLRQIQAHILPNGQTVYVNAPAPQGYTTMQYHPHQQQSQQQQRHIVGNALPGGMPLQNDQQQYISVVPIQRTGSPPGSTYAYIHQPNDGYGGPRQTVTIYPGANGNNVPVQVARVGNLFPPPAQESPPQRQQRNQQYQQKQKQNQHQRSMADQPSSQVRGKEKSSRNRRSNGNGNGSNSSSRRSGGNESKTGSPKSPTQNGNGNGNGTERLSGQQLLEEFKAKKHSRDWTIKDIEGHVVEFCQDQNGSRFVQQRLEVGGAAEKVITMDEALPHVKSLRNDVFGNYVVQKLFDFGTPDMKDDLRATMNGEMVELSQQMYGCRVVQKALETLDEADLPKLLEEFHSNVLSLIHDQNGNHVIQKCIEVISQKAKEAERQGDVATATFLNEQIEFIVEDVLENVLSLSCHPYGCRVLQRILEHCAQVKKDLILDELMPSHRRLLDDQYGNYVIQHVLQFGRVQDRDKVLEIVVANGLLKLSKQKFASNVVEKLLKYGNAEQRKSIAREMLKSVDETTMDPVRNKNDGTSVVLLMVRDPYANYVVQTTIDVVPPQSKERKQLLEELNKHSTELKTYTFAKHIVSKLNS